MGLNANPYKNAIEQGDYEALKFELYTKNPNVLERVDGVSILDYSIAKKDKRAAVIIADYNNSNLKEKRLVEIEMELSKLKFTLQESNENKGFQQLIELQDEKLSIITEQNKNKIEAFEERLVKLEDQYIKLSQQVMPLEIKQKMVTLKNFFEERID